MALDTNRWIFCGCAGMVLIHLHDQDSRLDNSINLAFWTVMKMQMCLDSSTLMILFVQSILFLIFTVGQHLDFSPHQLLNAKMKMMKIMSGTMYINMYAFHPIYQKMCQLTMYDLRFVDQDMFM